MRIFDLFCEAVFWCASCQIVDVDTRLGWGLSGSGTEHQVAKQWPSRANRLPIGQTAGSGPCAGDWEW